jgi:glycosyltransferase involved in cell wall biosynthesis
LPRWADRWLDHPALLRLVSDGSSADPAKLGDMTVSMLRGEEGHQRKELASLVEWLAGEVRPEVVHLSNAMMLGLAPAIARACGAPVVCTLSGEDIFLEKLKPPYYEQARQLLRDRAAEIDAFVAMNGYYADFMSQYLSIPRDRIELIPHGLDQAGHEPRKSTADDRRLRIGFLARICYDKGPHLLVEACELLAGQVGVPPFELHMAGYLGQGDRRYMADLLRRLANGPLMNRFKYHGEPDRAEKIAFLQALDVMALPTVYRESKGISVLEAWANAAPVVLPAHGAFPEMISRSGAGLLHRPLDVHDLADKLAELLHDSDRRRSLAEAGRRAVHEHYTAELMGRKTRELYRRLVTHSSAKAGGAHTGCHDGVAEPSSLGP